MNNTATSSSEEHSLFQQNIKEINNKKAVLEERLDDIKKMIGATSEERQAIQEEMLEIRTKLQELDEQLKTIPSSNDSSDNQQKTTSANNEQELTIQTTLIGIIPFTLTSLFPICIISVFITEALLMFHIISGVAAYVNVVIFLSCVTMFSYTFTTRRNEWNIKSDSIYMKKVKVFSTDEEVLRYNLVNNVIVYNSMLGNILGYASLVVVSTSVRHMIKYIPIKDAIRAKDFINKNLA